MVENQKNLEDKTTCDEKNSNWVVPYFAMDIMFNIFTRLHARKVQKLKYSCKEWYKVINSSRFVDAHLYESNPGLIAIPNSMTLPRKIGTRYIHPDFIRMKGGKVIIRELRVKSRKFVECICNGLVLLEDMVGDLSVSNPVTGQMLTLPPCTTKRSECLDILHGMTFVDSTGEYKVVSLVVNKSRALRCEMLALGSNTWKSVSSPFGCLFRCYFRRHCSISIKRVLHFIYSGTFEADDEALRVINVVSFDTAEENFYKSEVPYRCCSNRLERLHEIDGCPSVVVPNGVGRLCQWDIWALKDMYKGEWEKQYSVDLTLLRDKYRQNCIFSCVVATLENGRFFFVECGGSAGIEYSVYDVQLQRLKSLGFAPHTWYILLPHVESLVPCRKP